MNKKERIIWASAVGLLLIVLMSGVFIGNADAATNGGFSGFVKLQRVFNIIKQDFVDIENVSDEVLINGAIKGMIEALGDKHSMYLTVEQLNDMTTTSDGKFGGVGMVISEKDNFIVVESAIDDTPAYNKGMRAGDLLIAVDGVTLEGVTVSEAANRLRGVPGTQVNVKFIRYGVTQEVTITRALIDVPSVKHDFINDDVGYIRLTQFAGTTSEHVSRALNEFKTRGVKSIVVDLRSNPGGLLNQVIDIVDMFVSEGVIVSTRGRGAADNTVNRANAFNTIVDSNVKVIVLVDKWSASASEIFAGAIKDLHRGTIIGESTYGKGSVQTIIRLGADGFKLTIAKYYTPSGISIEGTGVAPDILIQEPEFTEDELKILENLINSRAIDNFLTSNPHPTEVQITAFVDGLLAEGYTINHRYLRRMVRQRIIYDNGRRPIFDLDYDIQLQRALEFINTGK